MLAGHQVSRELVLKQKLAPAQPTYDYCVIDTPPSLRVPTLNALAMSDLTIVPVESSMFALLGLTQLLRTIAKVRKLHSPEMSIMALSTMYTARQNLDKTIRARVVEKFTEPRRRSRRSCSLANQRCSQWFARVEPRWGLR